MGNLNWCKKQKNGVKLVEPNLNIAKSYLDEAKRDFGLIDVNEVKWNVIKEYYVCYNAFYSLLVKSGIKCEIHDCSLKLMGLFGIEGDMQNQLVDLKRERIDSQYYLKRSRKDYFDFTEKFLEWCEVKFIELNDLEIKRIREIVKNG